jgi:hypothetical protein
MLSDLLHLNGVAVAMLMSELFIAIICSSLACSAITVKHNRKIMPK